MLKTRLLLLPKLLALLELADDLKIGCEDRFVCRVGPGVETELANFVVELAILCVEERGELARPVVRKDEPEDFEVAVRKETADVSLLWDE